MDDTKNDRLTSWKEIAAYLGIETRSAMRWEGERGLPVHRVPGGKRNAVFAFRSEIDAWMAGAPPRSDAAPIAPAARLAMRLHPLAWTSIGAVAALVIVTVSLFITSRVRGSSAPATLRIEFVGEKLVALNEAGDYVWAREFPGLMAKPGGGMWRLTAERVRKVDVDGDGVLEILAVTHVVPDPASGQSIVSAELHCLDLNGRLKWSFRPQYRLRFARSEFAAPWVIYDFVVARDEKGPAVWALVDHHLWWPALLVRLDAQGRDSVQFVSSGQLSSIGFFEDKGKRRLLVGGYNNEYRAGSLAVVDPDAPPALSPQSKDSEYHCWGAACPRGGPLQYFAFPRSELNQLEEHPTNPAIAVRLAGEHVQVETYEAGPGSEHRSIYKFSRTPELTLLDQLFNDGYWQAHRNLERAGKIHHTDTACPARARPTPIRTWSPSSDWYDIIASTSKY